MKKLYSIITLSIFILMLFSFMAFTTYRSFINPIEEINQQPIQHSPIIIEIPEIKIIVTSHQSFLDAIGHRESSNNYKAINQFGYLGKYQFGRSTLNNLGYKKISNKEFLNTPLLQEKAMNDLLKHNKKILKRQIKKYNGKIVNGVIITESGILAAAHLAGPGNVKKWLRKGVDFEDGNGTKMTSYLKQFTNYNLYL